ncbi:DUF4399 domain-containing protein [Phaeobacter inhibens]|uniref:DUF4399 domain-containing protein n=1 Tax=Phaeobacter inhibens TaxID=221822 RepID=UPI00016326A4|nr:DUF4399 domain-containing protein [Phaeobacter inhibens]AFO92572.1 hypothetical protein PGA1_c29150 [Phaeobacter inhibens DSM 17395]AUQ47274.1 Domain protein of unknown function [Phaeobacter inhibens]AXT23892.1 DUF4399 domain-containing protein [Phaeobacter inhibens]
MNAMIRSTLAAVVACALPVSAALAGGETPAPDGAEVYFVTPKDGEVVSAPVTVVFGLRGMGVAPAGTEKENTGHHHLLIDRPPLGEGEDGADELSYGLPSDENHIHFGGGQTETTLDLAPGEHTLQLVMGDYGHVPHSTPIFSELITIKVE